jgi:hypothetical protein
LDALRRPRLWAWALLAGVPPEALAWWNGWDLVDPLYLAALVVWWPVQVWAGLIVLQQLLTHPKQTQGAALSLPAALNAELLLSFRSGAVALAGMTPALAVLACLGWERPAHRLVFLALAGLGLLPAFYYFLRRALAPLGVLLHGLNGPAALDWSAQRLAGRLPVFLKFCLPWWLLGWSLEGLALLCPDGLAVLGWLAGPPALLAGLWPLARWMDDER